MQQSVSKWLKESVDFMRNNPEYTLCRYTIKRPATLYISGKTVVWNIEDTKYVFALYWSAGFGSDARDDVLQAPDDPDYALVCGLKLRNDAEWDGYFMDSPWDAATGDVLCDEFSIAPQDDFDVLAQWLCEDYEQMLRWDREHEDDDGILIGYDPEDDEEYEIA